MIRKGVKKYSNGKKSFSVLVFIIIFLLGLILPKSVKADNGEKNLNYFYAMAINNVLAVINSSNTEEQNNNSKNNMKVTTLSFLGIDILNPLSIVKKEIAYLDNNEGNADVSIDNESDGVEKRKTFILNPFNLDDKQISKVGDKVEAANVITELYNPKLKQTLSNTNPRVLIYHSHTSEAYRATDKDISQVNSNTDQTVNVCAVGDVIKEELEKKYGISVIHDKTVHDTVNYKTAYNKSGVTLDKYLKKYEKFDLIIDLHRDGVPATYKNVKNKVNGEDVAKVMFVMTRTNPRYAKQKKLVSSMIGISNKLFPGLMDTRQIYLYDRGIKFYSQDKSDNAVLIEVGNNSDSIEQAKNTGKYLSRIIAEQLNGKK